MESKNNVVTVFQLICDKSDIISKRTSILKKLVEDSNKVREEIIKDSIESDTEVNSDNYFKYYLTIQLQQADLIEEAKELVYRYDTFLEFGSAMDFPVDVIETVEKAREYTNNRNFKLSNDATKLIPTSLEKMEEIKESVNKLFQTGFQEKWANILSNAR